MDFFANHLKIDERAARNAEEGPEGKEKGFIQMRLKTEGPSHIRFENLMSYGLFVCVEIALQSIV